MECNHGINPHPPTIPRHLTLFKIVKPARKVEYKLNQFNSTTALPTTVCSPYSLYVPTSDIPTTTAIIDSGATSNYCQFDSTTTPCFDVKPTTKSNRGASTQQPYDHEHARRILASTALIQRSTCSPTCKHPLHLSDSCATPDV